MPDDLFYTFDTEPEPEPERYDDDDDDDDEYDDGPFAHAEQERDDYTAAAAAPLAASEVILLPHPRRRPRLVSVEQEMSGTDGYGGHIAATLYDRGLSRYDHRLGYHDGGRSEQDAGGCWIEADSSCGSELIYDRLRLDTVAGTATLRQGNQIVREMIEGGTVALTNACGFHIHIDARGLSSRNLASLLNLWNHAEDVIYRLASARWNNHRDEVTGSDYSPPPPKPDATTSHARALRSMRNGRYGLNLSPILSAAGMCNCGAFAFEDWASCTCTNLPQPTVEFRVFNATANPRKIRAYVVLAVSMVEHARTHRITPPAYPPNPWRGTSLLSENATVRPLRYLLNNLPLTARDREDLIYLVRHSSLNRLSPDALKRAGLPAHAAAAA